MVPHVVCAQILEPDQWETVARVWQPLCEVAARRNGSGRATIETPDPRFLYWARQEGALLRVTLDNDEIFSGQVVRVAQKNASREVTGTVSAVSLWEMMMEWQLGWPEPSWPLASQPQTWNKTGPTETVVKQIVSANLADWPRHGDTFIVNVEPDQGRGPTTTVTSRFETLDSAVRESLSSSDLHFWWEVIDRYPTFRCRNPQTHKVSLDMQGVVSEASWEVRAPEATRAVIGGWGEGTARKFLQGERNDARWFREVFLDARDVQPDDNTTEAQALVTLQRRLDQGLKERSATTTVELELLETEGFRFGNPYTLGDKVTVNLGDGWKLTDYIEQVTIKITKGNGIQVVPMVGGVSASPDVELGRAIRGLKVRMQNERAQR